jgi:hypothetical protein
MHPVTACKLAVQKSIDFVDSVFDEYYEVAAKAREVHMEMFDAACIPKVAIKPTRYILSHRQSFEKQLKEGIKNAYNELFGYMLNVERVQWKMYTYRRGIIRKFRFAMREIAEGNGHIGHISHIPECIEFVLGACTGFFLSAPSNNVTVLEKYNAVCVEELEQQTAQWNTMKRESVEVTRVKRSDIFKRLPAVNRIKGCNVFLDKMNNVAFVAVLSQLSSRCTVAENVVSYITNCDMEPPKGVEGKRLYNSLMRGIPGVFDEISEIIQTAIKEAWQGNAKCTECEGCNKVDKVKRRCDPKHYSVYRLARMAEPVKLKLVDGTVFTDLREIIRIALGATESQVELVLKFCRDEPNAPRQPPFTWVWTINYDNDMVPYPQSAYLVIFLAFIFAGEQRMDTCDPYDSNGQRFQNRGQIVNMERMQSLRFSWYTANQFRLKLSPIHYRLVKLGARQPPIDYTLDDNVVPVVKKDEEKEEGPERLFTKVVDFTTNDRRDDSAKNDGAKDNLFLSPTEHADQLYEMIHIDMAMRIGRENRPDTSEQRKLNQQELECRLRQHGLTPKPVKPAGTGTLHCK